MGVEKEEASSGTVISRAHGSDLIPPRLEQIEEVRTPLWKSQGASAEYHFAMAQAYVVEGSPDQAIEEYRLALAHDPKSALLHARLAAEYVKKGEIAPAIEASKEAIRLDPGFIDARLLLAGLYAEGGEPENALAEYRTIRVSHPHHEETAVYEAQVLADMGRGEEAAKSLRAFTKTHPKAVVGWFYLGKAEQQLEHFNAAETAYRKALEVKPGFGLAALALGYLYETQGKNTPALEVYRSLYLESQDTAAAGRMVTILLKTERFAEAIPYLEFLRNSDPQDLNTQVKLGLVQMELHQNEQAVRTFQGILDKNPESDRVRFYLGSLYEEGADAEAAISQYRLITVSSKFYDDSVLRTAHLLNQKGRATEAREALLQGMERSPGSAGFPIYLASLDEDAKDFSGAVTRLESALLRFPEDERIRYYLGSLYDKLGRVDDALKQMDWILTKTPDHADALNYVGYTWTMRGIRLAEAEKLLRRALASKPDNPYIQDSLGWHFFVRGRFREAVVTLEKAAEMKPTETVILEHLADTYLKLNLREKALRNYHEALRYVSDDASRRKLEDKMKGLLREIAGAKPSEESQTTVAIPAAASRKPANSDD